MAISPSLLGLQFAEPVGDRAALVIGQVAPRDWGAAKHGRHRAAHEPALRGSALVNRSLESDQDAVPVRGFPFF